MLNFKQFLMESACNCVVPEKTHDFITHLMSPVVASHQGDAELMEVTLYAHKPGGDRQIPRGKKVPVPNVLSHPAVAEKDNEEHVGRYIRLMENGKKIARDAGKGTKVLGQMRRGFSDYTDAVNSGGEAERKRRLKEARAHHVAWRKEVAGYGSGAKFLGQNTKIAKNEKKAELSTGLSLSPYTMHGVEGHNACQKASSECRNSCLAYTTGKNAMLSNINSKIAKHQYMMQHPHHAAALLENEMRKHIEETAKMNDSDHHEREVARHTNAVNSAKDEKTKAQAQARLDAAKKAQQEHKDGKRYQAGFRMNVLQDYPIHHLMGGIMERAHAYAKSKGVDMVVRDYTKHAERLEQERHPNHYMALSSTGADHEESNESDVGDALHNGHTVAAVVANDPNHGKITHVYDHKHDRYHPVVDGDKDDMIENRHEEAGFKKGADQKGYDEKGRAAGVVSGLEIKGASGEVKAQAGKFVHTANPTFNNRHVDSHGRSLPEGAVVTEINKNTHEFGKEKQRET